MSCIRLYEYTDSRALTRSRPLLSLKAGQARHEQGHARDQGQAATDACGASAQPSQSSGANLDGLRRDSDTIFCVRGYLGEYQKEPRGPANGVGPVQTHAPNKVQRAVGRQRNRDFRIGTNLSAVQFKSRLREYVFREAA